MSKGFPLLLSVPSRCYLASLWWASPYVPILTIGATVVSYTLWGGNERALSGGLAFGLASWLALALAGSYFATPANANTRTWIEFRGRLEDFKIRIRHASRRLENQQGSREWEALEEATRQLVFICEQSRKLDTRWVRSIGYQTLWQALHDGEEALIEATKREALREGQHDEKRLHGSAVPERKALLQNLRVALKALDREAAFYFNEQPQPVAPVDWSSDKTVKKNGEPTDDSMAMMMIREVRSAFNQYADERYAALARTRNNLMFQMWAIAWAVYFLLALTVIAVDEGGREGVLAGSSFLALGALAGLLARWSGRSKADKTVEDFGLANAQLLQSMVLGAVAGFIGAVLYLTAPAMFGLDVTPEEAAAIPSPTPVITTSPAAEGERTGNADGVRVQAMPIPTGESATTSTEDEDQDDGQHAECPEDVDPGEIPALRCIFRLEGGGLVIAWLFAAAFGLAPDRMFNLLSRQTDKFKDEIQSTKAADNADTQK